MPPCLLVSRRSDLSCCKQSEVNDNMSSASTNFFPYRAARKAAWFLLVSPSTTTVDICNLHRRRCQKLCRHSFSTRSRVVLLRGFAQFPCLRSVCPLRHFGECCQRVRSGVSTKRIDIAFCKTPTMCPPCCGVWHTGTKTFLSSSSSPARRVLPCSHTRNAITPEQGGWRVEASVSGTLKYFTHGEKQNKTIVILVEKQ